MQCPLRNLIRAPVCYIFAFAIQPLLPPLLSRSFSLIEKCRLDYKHCFIAHRNQPSQQSLTNCIDSHNTYVQQLHTTNAMLNEYYGETIPMLMAELEDIYAELCQIVADAIFNGSDIIASKVILNIEPSAAKALNSNFPCVLQASDQKKRFDGLTMQCKNMSPEQDLISFVRLLQPDTQTKVPKKSYAPPINDVDEVCVMRRAKFMTTQLPLSFQLLATKKVKRNQSKHNKCNKNVFSHRVD